MIKQKGRFFDYYIMKCDKCGHEIKIYSFLVKIKNIWNDKYYKKCNQCGYTICFQTVSHVVKDILDDKMKNDNRYEYAKKEFIRKIGELK